MEQRENGDRYDVPRVCVSELNATATKRIQKVCQSKGIEVVVTQKREAEEDSQPVDAVLTPCTSDVHGCQANAGREIWAAAASAIWHAFQLPPGGHTVVEPWVAVRLSGGASFSTGARVANAAGYRYLRLPDGAFSCIAGDSEWRTWDEELMNKLREFLGTVSFGDNLLLQGESGTGKTTLARLIHWALGGLQDNFVRVGADVLLGRLMQSQTWGCVRGAYTGATEDRPGLAERAAGGTFLLDEIDPLDSRAQNILLRFLESREFERVGSNETKVSPCTVIACCNQSVDELLRNEKLLPEFYFRIADKTFVLPPLRERPADIAGFTCIEITRAVLSGMPAKRFRRSALLLLQEHTWSGNFRELATNVRAILAGAPGDTVEATDVYTELVTEKLSRIVLEALAQGKSLAEILETVWKLILVRALLASRGNVSEAARNLDVNRDRIYRLAKKFGIDIGRVRQMLNDRQEARDPFYRRLTLGWSLPRPRLFEPEADQHK